MPLPSYFTPLAAQDNGGLPDYFEPIEEEKKKKEPGLLSRFIKEVTNPTPGMVKAQNDIPSKVAEGAKKVWEKASEPLTEAPTKFAESVSKYINPNSETKGARGISSAYIEGLGHAASGLSSPLNLGFALISGGASAAAKAGMSEVASALNIGTKVLSAPMVAEGVKNIHDAKDVPEFLSGVLEAGMGAAGMRSGVHGKALKEELPIRRPNDYVNKSKEVPYRIEGEIPTPKVAEPAETIAANKRANLADYMKEHPDAKVGELKKFMESVESAKTPPDDKSGGAGVLGTREQGAGPEASDWDRKHVVLPKIIEEAPIVEPAKKPSFNPFEKKAQIPVEEINKLDDYQQYRKVELEAGRKPVHFAEWGNRKLNLDPNRFPIAKEPPKPVVERDKEDILFDIARKKQNMGMEVPETKAETRIKEYETMKDNLNTRQDAGQVVDYEEELANLDREYGVISSMSKENKTIINEIMKTNDEGHTVYPPGYKGDKPIGKFVRKLSDGSDVYDPTNKPTAEYAYDWPDAGGKQYHIRGGPSDGSTVGEAKLKSLGIEIPQPQPSAEMKFSPKLSEQSFKFEKTDSPDMRIVLDSSGNKIGELYRGWSRLGGDGWTHDGIKTEKSLAEAAKNLWKSNQKSSAEGKKLPDYFEPIEAMQSGERVQPSAKSPDVIEHPLINAEGKAGTPESLHPQLTALRNYGDGTLHLEFDKTKAVTENDIKAMFPDKNVDVTEMYTDKNLPSRFRVDIQGKDPGALGDDIERSVGGAFDKNKISELSGGLGGINPSKRELEPTKGPYGAALDKLFNSMGKILENRVQQDIINKTERARRFAAFSSVEDVGVSGAAKSLSALKGEFEKVNLEKLKLTKPQADSLFTAVKRAKITEGEKARGYTALFKLLNGEALPQRNELRVLDDVFGQGFSDRIIQMHGGLGVVGVKLGKTANTMKSMMASTDLSFPLRQGIGMVHRPEWRSAVKEQLKYMAKPEYFNAAMEAIEERPKYMLGREAGLFLAKPGGLLNGEEAFMNSYISDIPMGAKGLYVKNVVEASERSYIGGLNKLRSDMFDNLTELADKVGKKTTFSKQLRDSKGNYVLENGNVKTVTVPSKVAEDIAKYINVFTGRGGLGKLERIATDLNTVFWSPRLVASRLTALNPKFYYDLDPFVRKEAIKSLFAIATASTVINTAGTLVGGTVGYNILSSDFMKTRFKNDSVLDPNGGYQQAVVAAAKMIAELNRMASGGKRAYNQPGIPEIASNFAVNKLSPLAGLAYDIASSRQMTGGGGYADRFGNKKSILDETGKRFVPMFIQDVYSIVNSDPDFAQLVGLTPLVLLGAGEQNYPEKKPTNKLQIRKLK